MSELLLKEILGELKNLNQRVGNLEEGQHNLVSKVDKLEKVQQIVVSKVDKLELRMENEVIDKIRTLFDADKIREDKLNQIVDKLESIEIDTGYLVSRVARLEKLAK